MKLLLLRMAGHLDLYERIIESMYDVTDRLTYHVCSRKPDHRVGQHLVIPQWGSTERNEMTLQARNKLQMVSKKITILYISLRLLSRTFFSYQIIYWRN